MFPSPVIVPCVKKEEGYASWVCHIAKYTPSCLNFQNDTSKTQNVFCYPTYTHACTHTVNPHAYSVYLPALSSSWLQSQFPPSSLNTPIPNLPSRHLTFLKWTGSQADGPTFEIIYKLFLPSGMFFHPLPQTPPTQFLISLHSFNLLLITPTEKSFLTPSQVRTLAYRFTQYPRHLQSSYQNCHFYCTKSSLTFVFATGL